MEVDSPPPPQTVPYPPRNGLYRVVPRDGEGECGLPEGALQKEEWDVGGDDSAAKSLKRTRSNEVVSPSAVAPDLGHPPMKRPRQDRADAAFAFDGDRVISHTSTQLSAAATEEHTTVNILARISVHNCVPSVDEQTANVIRETADRSDRTADRSGMFEADGGVLPLDSNLRVVDLSGHATGNPVQCNDDRSAVRERLSLQFGQSCASQNSHLVNVDFVKSNCESPVMGLNAGDEICPRVDQKLQINSYDDGHLTSKIPTELSVANQPVNFIKQVAGFPGISCTENDGKGEVVGAQGSASQSFCGPAADSHPDQTSNLTTTEARLEQSTLSNQEAAQTMQLCLTSSSVMDDANLALGLVTADSTLDTVGDSSVHVYTSNDEMVHIHRRDEDATESPAKTKSEEDESHDMNIDEAEGFRREKRQSARVAAIRLSGRRGTLEERKRRKAEEQEERRRKKEEQQEKKKQRAEELAEKRRKKEEEKVRKAAEMEEKKRQKAIEKEEKKKRREAELEEKKRRREEMQERLRRKEEERELQRRQQNEAKAKKIAEGEEPGAKQRAPAKRRKKADVVQPGGIVDDVEEGEDGWKKNAGLTLEDRERIPLGPMSGVERVLSWLWGKHCLNADLPPYLHHEESRECPVPSSGVEAQLQTQGAQVQ